MLKCTNGSGKNRARIRLIDPPEGQEYDFSVTFSADAIKPYFGQICSFKGKQFIWVYQANDSGLTLVKNKGFKDNGTATKKGIRAGTRNTPPPSRCATISSPSISTTNFTPATPPITANSRSPTSGASARRKPIGFVSQCPSTITAVSISGPDGAPINIPGLATAGQTADAAPAAPAKPSPASAYKQLAAIITNSYSLQSSAAATQPAARSKPLADDLQAVVALNQEGISNVAQDFAAPPPKTDDAFFQAALTVTGRSDAAPARIADPLLEHVNADDPPILIGNVNLLPDGAPNSDRAAFDLEQARVAAWQKLIAQMTQIYPKAKPTPGAVKLAIGPYSFFATNTSPTALTNVTLIVEIVRSTSSPSPTGRQYFFIPNWPANKKIFLPTTTTPNLTSPELLARVAPPPIWGVTGMIEARVQVWSDQVSQEIEPTKFDTNIEPLAKALINDAYSAVDDVIHRPAAARATTASAVRVALANGPAVMPKVTLADNTPALAQAHADARKALDILPPDSPLAAEAKAIDADPQTALHDYRKKQLDDFIAALPQQKSRTGVWAVHKPGLLAKMMTPQGRQSALSGGGDRAGHVTMIVDARNANGDVTVTLFNPDQPTTKRKLAGHVQVDNSANRLILQLKSPPTTPRPIADADLKVLNNWTRMLLELKTDTLRGTVEVGTGDSAVVLNIGFDAPQDLPVPAKK